MEDTVVTLTELNELETRLFGDNRRTTGLRERNRQTLVRVEQFRREIAESAISKGDYLNIAREHPYFGILPCFAAQAEFVMMYANDDVVAREYLWFGKDAYEPEIIKRWWDWCKTPGLVLDIGGYSGLMSILAASASVGNDVHLFEPMEAICERARLNVKLNGFGKRITVHNIAASNKNGEETINLFRPSNGPLHGTGSSLYKKGMENKEIVETKKIIAQVLDDYLPDVEPSVVKIDVEGHELPVLQGMQKTLRRSKPRLIIEVWQHTRHEVLSFLESMGYHLEQVETKTKPVNNFFAV